MKQIRILVFVFLICAMSAPVVQAQIVNDSIRGAIVGGLIGGKKGAKRGAAIGATVGAVKRMEYNQALRREQIAREQYYATPRYHAMPHPNYHSAPPTIIVVN